MVRQSDDSEESRLLQLTIISIVVADFYWFVLAYHVAVTVNQMYCMYVVKAFCC